MPPPPEPLYSDHNRSNMCRAQFSHIGHADQWGEEDPTPKSAEIGAIIGDRDADIFLLWRAAWAIWERRRRPGIGVLMNLRLDDRLALGNLLIATAGGEADM